MPECRNASGGLMRKLSVRRALLGAVFAVAGLVCVAVPARADADSSPSDPAATSGTAASVSVKASTGSERWARVRWPLAGVLASAVVLVLARQIPLLAALGQRAPARRQGPVAANLDAPQVALADDRLAARAWERDWPVVGTAD
jgi:drug/metabolite transporter (DMT)-like permease